MPKRKKKKNGITDKEFKDYLRWVHESTINPPKSIEEDLKDVLVILIPKKDSSDEKTD